MLGNKGRNEPNVDAWVGFRDAVGLSWMGLLKPGFRHCFVLLRKEEGWIVCDPLSHYTMIDFVKADDGLLDHLAAGGCLLIPAHARVPARLPLPWRPFTCVEAVKRILGLRAPWTLTPWQLCRRLTQEHKKILKAEKNLLTWEAIPDTP